MRCSRASVRALCVLCEFVCLVACAFTHMHARAHTHRDTHSLTQAFVVRPTGMHAMNIRTVTHAVPSTQPASARVRSDLCLGQQQQQRMSRGLLSHRDRGRLLYGGHGRREDLHRPAEGYRRQAVRLLLERRERARFPELRPRRLCVPAQAVAVRWCVRAHTLIHTRAHTHTHLRTRAPALMHTQTNTHTRARACAQALTPRVASRSHPATSAAGSCRPLTAAGACLTKRLRCLAWTRCPGPARKKISLTVSWRSFASAIATTRCFGGRWLPFQRTCKAHWIKIRPSAAS